MTRIDGLNPLATSRTQQGRGATPAEGTGAHRGEGAEAGGRLDQVSLSRRGRAMAETAGAVAAAPDVRAEKVAALKAAIAGGAYRSDPHEIAVRLLATGFGQD
jgi:flagellar biosynthesis anti-sigma factor FlgM